MLCSLPMYPHAAPALAELWGALRQRLQAGGLAELPATLMQPDDYLAHWRAPQLLLSQSCGYPVAALLADTVTVLGAFHYEVPGCRGYHYSSQLLVRHDDPRQQLADFRGARAACNEAHSQSGYHALRSLVAALPQPQPFFSEVRFSGGHRYSARLVADGSTDIAALDCVSAWLLAREEPQVFAQLRCIGHSALVPGLPLITGRHTPPAVVQLLRQSLADCVADPALQATLQLLRIRGFTPLSNDDYLPLRQRAAANLAHLGAW
ncbi:phosphate/phosphite/phosphonate ABC transporter substrate-binding protein [Vogesella facilis]|uniref:Phosphate/phosphite/phosphonate ABC transporter substrate-binding protein n=1 Tax=Vogesella facilis TaxID=1655232 RepID=A0ABV7RIR6_9NEIS